MSVALERKVVSGEWSRVEIRPDGEVTEHGTWTEVTIEADGKRAGWARLEERRGEVVVSQLESQGHLRALLRAVRDSVPDKCLWCYVVDERLARVYERLGFQKAATMMVFGEANGS